MGVLKWAELVVAFLMAATSGTLLWMRYDTLCEDIERDAGWHRMWTERIWEDERGR